MVTNTYLNPVAQADLTPGVADDVVGYECDDVIDVGQRFEQAKGELYKNVTHRLLFGGLMVDDSRQVAKQHSTNVHLW